MQVTYQASAYLDLKYDNLKAVVDGKTTPLLAEPEGCSYYDGKGYVRIGTATVTVELRTENEIAANQLAALQKQLQAVRAENQQRENAILDQISKLQALTHNATVVEA